MATNRDRILCLEESRWYGSLQDRDSVLPALELLQRQELIRFIHRDVATTAEFEFYLGPPAGKKRLRTA